MPPKAGLPPWRDQASEQSPGPVFRNERPKLALGKSSVCPCWIGRFFFATCAVWERLVLDGEGAPARRPLVLTGSDGYDSARRIAGADDDVIRARPGVTRSFEAGPEGLEVLIFGPHVEGDGETVADF